MGYVPLVIWFVCITTLLLLLTKSTLARSYRAVLTKKLTYQELVAALLASVEQLPTGQSIGPMAFVNLVSQLPQIAQQTDAISKKTWLAADREVYASLALSEYVWLESIRPQLVIAAQSLHNYETALKSYNEFVKTLPTSYGALLFGYKKMIA